MAVANPLSIDSVDDFPSYKPPFLPDFQLTAPWVSRQQFSDTYQVRTEKCSTLHSFSLAEREYWGVLGGSQVMGDPQVTIGFNTKMV